MNGRLAIPGAWAASGASMGSAFAALMAHALDLPGLPLVVFTLMGGVVAGVATVAAMFALGVPLAAGAPRVAAPTSEAPPAPRQGLDPDAMAAELERLATMRSTDIRLTLGSTPRELLFALGQLADRLAEDHRRLQQQDAQLREATARHGEMSRQLYLEVERLQAEVRAANTVRDAFLARMSHELRTPLNAIFGYIEMLEEEAEDEALRDDLGRVRSSAASLLAIVTTILDLTQLETDSFDVIPEAVDLHTLGEQVRQSVMADARANENAFTVDISKGLHAYLDRRMLQSILFNLASNACKYTTRGEVKLQVREAEDDRLIIQVSDTGIGMTERQIKEAFRPFGQADGSTTRRYDGAGLGLAVVRGFAEAMGGQVQIDSELGKGAQVTVDLPIQCSPRSAAVNEDGPTMLVR